MTSAIAVFVALFNVVSTVGSTVSNGVVIVSVYGVCSYCVVVSDVMCGCCVYGVQCLSQCV